MSGPRPISDALWNYSCEYDAIGLIKSFAVPDQQPEAGLVKNFLGTKIPPKVFPPVLEKMKGQVENIPHPGNWHADIAEWSAALLSVARAKDTYRIVELGCGWGCWLVNMGAAARARGLRLDLIGIEGDRNHLSNAAEVLALNGFLPDNYSLHHAVAGPRPGKALFPAPKAGTAAWGGEAVFYPDEMTLRRAETDPAVQILNCMTLAELSNHEPIDLLHIDIQGAEDDYVTGNMTGLENHVCRVLIGTHSRAIEGRLITHFLDAGWIMEMERPAIAPLSHGRPVIRIDGVQLWSNPRLVTLP